MVIVSNGRLLRNRKFTENLFKNGLDRAVISLEGADDNVHNKLTGRDSFGETVQGIRNCVEIGLVNTLTTICRGNSHQIANIIRVAYQLGVNKAVLNCAIPVLSEDFISANQSLDPLELAEVINNVFWELAKENIPFQLNATFPLCLLPKNTLSEAFALDWLSVGCHMYRGKGIVFDPQGNILSCTHFSKAPLIENTMGNNGEFMLKNTFSDTWDNPNSAAGKFRSLLWRYPARKCKDCEYWGGCIGGCPLFWLYFDPQQFIDRNERR